MTIDWDELLRVYREALEDEAIVERVVRRWLTQHGMVSSAEGLADILAELERRSAEPPPEPVATLPPVIPRDFEFIRTRPDDPPLDPAPLFPPPPPSAPQAEPAALSLPELAPSARQEPPMSVSPEFGAVLFRALPTALSMYQVAHDSGAIDEIADAIGGVARKAKRLARQGPLTEDERTDLRKDACKQIRCVLNEIPEEALEALGEVAIAAIDEHTNTGPIDEVDGVIARKGLSALTEWLREWTELDPGNLEALAKRARKTAARAEREAERLEKIAARKRARG